MTESRARTWTPDPALPGYVTDGGLETDLIGHHGVQLPELAAFLLLVDPKGRGLLTAYYAAYAGIAAAARDRRVFDTLVEIGLGDGLIDRHLAGGLAGALARRGASAVRSPG